ncbi:hypothetical protein DFH07DRAFT_679896, partial [Mycena maculata]
MDVKCQHCGAFHWIGEKTSNSSVRAPKFGMCCNHGKVEFPDLEAPPEALRLLLTGNDDKSVEYRKNMWQYNVALSFTSLGIKEDRSVTRGRGPPLLKIQG